MKKTPRSGFTLIELLVSVAVFAIVMVIGVAALLSMVDASHKAQSLKSVMNNLNFALENMSRNIRVGTHYHCQTTNTPSGSLDTPLDCTSGGILIAFEPRNGSSSTVTDQVVYRLNGQQLERSIDGGITFVAITAPEVVITNFKFYVSGAASSDTLQPKVVMTVAGSVGISPKNTTTFNLETMVSQRLLDLPE